MRLMEAWRQLRDRIAAPPRRPRIHLYCVCWNEERMLPFLFRHYDPWVERYVFYDDSSTDATLEILRAHPRVEIRPFVRTVPDSFVLSAQAVHDSCWKESRGAADWVMIIDVDEHLYHPDLAAYLAACKREGVSAIPALGYQMTANSFPEGDRPLCELVRIGDPSESMSKLSLFDPNRLSSTRFAVGRHSAKPKGRLRYPKEDRLLNLHFKKLGLDYLVDRYRLLASKRGARDRARKFGIHYDTPAEVLAERYAVGQGRGIDVIAAGELALRNHPHPRWWRPDWQPANVQGNRVPHRSG